VEGVTLGRAVSVDGELARQIIGPHGGRAVRVLLDVHVYNQQHEDDDRQGTKRSNSTTMMNGDDPP